MSPYRVACPPEPSPPPAEPRRFVIAGLATFALAFAAAAIALVLPRRAHGDAEADRRVAELQRAADEDARRIAELERVPVAPPSRADESPHAGVEVLRERHPRARPSAGLAQCVCAEGDPLCSEIPGQNCRP